MSRHKPLPSPEYLWECFSYSPLLGEFRWRVPRPGWSVGRVAGGSIDDRGYVRVTLDGQHYRLHRLVWCWVTGEDPGQLEIDHIDGDPTNNKWNNLRPATHQQNCLNTPCYANNKAGFKGVHQVKGYQRWRASIRIDGKLRHIGYYQSPEEAHAAYCAAAQALRGDLFWRPV
jgi:hypothetical protein